MNREMNFKGQVWIETVLYTLIGLALIGVALGFIMPKINQARDKALVEQAIGSLNEVDSKMNEVIERGTGNIRQTEFLMKKGEFYIKPASDEIVFVLTDLSAPYSEPGVEITSGRVNITSEVGQKTSTVTLKVAYNANITYDGKEDEKKFSAAATAYKLSMENKGPLNGKIWINIEEISNR
jgi:type II secretory pathway pseudopilin PulG